MYAAPLLLSTRRSPRILEMHTYKIHNTYIHTYIQALPALRAFIDQEVAAAEPLAGVMGDGTGGREGGRDRPPRLNFYVSYFGLGNPPYYGVSDNARSVGSAARSLTCVCACKMPCTHVRERARARLSLSLSLSLFLSFSLSISLSLCLCLSLM